MKKTLWSSILIASVGVMTAAQTLATCKELIKGRVVRENAAEQGAPMETMDDSLPGTPGKTERHPRRIRKVEPRPDEDSKGGDNSIVKIDDFIGQPQKAKRGEVHSISAEMNPSGIFDLGADANSKELVLAWERWHKQFCGTIYNRTCRRTANFPGMSGSATCRITVMRNQDVDVQLLNTNGSPQIAQCYVDAVRSLIGNPGLTFPEKSCREYVTFEYSFIRSPFVRPGYDWKHNDYETVQE